MTLVDTEVGDRREQQSTRLTVLVPTRNEAENVDEVVDRVTAALTRAALTFELLFVDDSDDATAARIMARAMGDERVRLIHRPLSERHGGLAGAVVQGTRAARGSVVVVMDGDLQHPPESIPPLVAPVLTGVSTVAVASRYCPGGSATGLGGPGRRLASLVARGVVHASFRDLREVSDPCGGFFAFRADLLDGVELTPDGYKILLEVLVRSGTTSVAEIPYRFHARTKGSSKFGRRETQRFFGHVRALRGGAFVGSWSGRIALVIVLAYLAVQGVLITAGGLRGPFLDEGIYITAGLRTWQGYAISDGYLTWFAGSLFWPVVAGAANALGGLVMTRLVGAALMAVGCWGSARASRDLFGTSAQPWTAAILVVSGPVLALGHLAVYDVLAVALVGLSLASVARVAVSSHRLWPVLAAVCLSGAVLAKYPTAALLVPIVAVLYLVRRDRFVMDGLLFGFVFTAIQLAAFLPARDQLARFVSWRVENNPAFGVTRSMIAYEAALFLLPLAVVAFAGALQHGPGRRIRLVMSLTLLVFPTYHILIGNSVGAPKHVVYGMLLAAPVAGSFVGRVAQSRRAVAAIAVVAIAGLGIGGWAQMRQLDRTWVDTSAAGRYLQENVVAGDVLYLGNKWPLLPALYNDGPLDDLEGVWDPYRVSHEPDPPDLCSVDWFVDEENSTGWDEATRSALAACGTFERVYEGEGVLTNLAPSLEYVSWSAGVVVWHNTAREAS